MWHQTVHFAQQTSLLAEAARVLSPVSRMGSDGSSRICRHVGCLCVQGPPDWHPAPAPVKEAASKAAKHASARGTDLAKLAITEFVRCYTAASHKQCCTCSTCKCGSGILTLAMYCYLLFPCNISHDALTEALLYHHSCWGSEIMLAKLNSYQGQQGVGALAPSNMLGKAWSAIWRPSCLLSRCDHSCMSLLSRQTYACYVLTEIGVPLQNERHLPQSDGHGHP